jgi:hypothetical protein
VYFPARARPAAAILPKPISEDTTAANAADCLPLEVVASVVCGYTLPQIVGHGDGDLTGRYENINHNNTRYKINYGENTNYCIKSADFVGYAQKLNCPFDILISLNSYLGKLM